MENDQHNHRNQKWLKQENFTAGDSQPEAKHGGSMGGEWTRKSIQMKLTRIVSENPLVYENNKARRLTSRVGSDRSF